MLDMNLEIEKFYIVYKTVNLINNKLYIGVHGTHNLDDSYIGSGEKLLLAIKKYGRENFTRTILYIAGSRAAAFHVESILVNETFLKRQDVYNVRLGGFGWIKTPKQRAQLVHRMKTENPAFNMSAETRQKMSMSKIGKPSNAKGNRKIVGDGKWIGTGAFGSDNKSSKLIFIYNDADEIVFKCCGSFHKLLKYKNMPVAYFRKSLELGTIPTIILKQIRIVNREKYLKYTGWYAKEIPIETIDDFDDIIYSSSDIFKVKKC